MDFFSEIISPFLFANNTTPQIELITKKGVILVYSLGTQVLSPLPLSVSVSVFFSLYNSSSAYKAVVLQL